MDLNLDEALEEALDEAQGDTTMALQDGLCKPLCKRAPLAGHD